MFSKIKTIQSINNYSNEIDKLLEAINKSDAIIIGAGAGLSTSAGHSYSGKRFTDNFADFQAKYAIPDMYSGGFYPFDSLEEYWAWWSRQIKINRYTMEENSTYRALLNLIEDTNYFVITTNVDHLFHSNGFDRKKLFATQGDYGLLQCSKGCHDKVYPNKELILQMVSMQKNMKIPKELIPYCPICNSPMVPHLRADDNFVQDEFWYTNQQRYNDFLNKNSNSKVLYLELGVGNNTPAIIKYPFWIMTSRNNNATYATINLGSISTMKEIEKRTIGIARDINEVLIELNS